MTEIIDFNSAAPQNWSRTIEADEIRQRLNSSAREFIKFLFGGRASFSRNEARIGDKYGTAGESLSITLEGPKTGLWYDHAEGAGGDLISLYMAYRGYNKAQFAFALREIAADFFCDPITLEKPSWSGYRPLREHIEEKKATLGTKPRVSHAELGEPIESYKYYSKEGRIVTIVRRYEPEGWGFDDRGKPNKTFRAWPGFPSTRILYRVPEIMQASHVVFCEGERAAEALVELGIEATSAMGGANTRVQMIDWSSLANKTVIIWPDKDKPGWNFGQAVAGILNQMGCKVSIIVPPEDKPKGWDAYDLIKDERGDPRELLDSAKPWTDFSPAEESKQRGRFELINIDALGAVAPPQWLIDGMITEGGFSVLWGPPACLKSFVAIDLSLPVASGKAWHGVPCVSGPVVYLAAEGFHGLIKRVLLWRHKRAKDVTAIPFEVMPQNVAIKEELDSLLSSIATMPVPPVLIIIDTLARTFGTGDENKQADMNAFVSAIDRLRDVTKAHVMVIHHSGVHENGRERGSNVLRGAADTVIKVERKGQHSVRLINRGPVGKQKDAAEFDDIKLYCFPDAYIDRDNNEQESLLLNLDHTVDDGLADRSSASTKEREAPFQQRVLDYLSTVNEPVGLTEIHRGIGEENASKRIIRAMESLVLKKKAELVSKEKPMRWRLI